MRWAYLAAAALGACAQSTAAAHADIVTLGSDLRAPATIAQAHQADTAFWPNALAGGQAAVPADGQVLSIRIKGTAVQPAGAPAPLNQIHFQSLDRLSDGTTKVYLTSGAFYLPYTGDPEQVNQFKPENLCVHRGGIVGFNDEGGWDGTYGGPYGRGVPFRIFGAVPGSSTDWYSQDNGTKNGALLAPPTLMGDTELLLQYTLATGDDRSYECGGPLRDAHGAAIPRMNVTPGQNAYVSSDGSFTVFGYCGDARTDCTGGSATVTVNGQAVATSQFSARSQTSINVPMRLSTADYARLASSPGAAWTATVTLTTPGQGTASGAVRMHSKAGGALHVVTPQRVYVRANRQITPAGFCGVPTGCSGSATLMIGGKVAASAKFGTKGKGAIRVLMRVPARVLRQARTRPVPATLSLTGPLGVAAGTVLLRH